MFSRRRDPVHTILWDQMDMNPAVQLKHGVARRLYPLPRIETKSRDRLDYANEHVELSGQWRDIGGAASSLRFRLKNVSSSSIRITRLIFPADNGLDAHLADIPFERIAFLRNGYQSWSTARSYSVTDKPLRPWLQLVSLATSNLANLPSNVPGVLSSEMYTVIGDSEGTDGFLVGQLPDFSQFFYIRLQLSPKAERTSYFELVFDFGRKMLEPGDEIKLDGIYLATGDVHDTLDRYFAEVKRRTRIALPRKNVKGWCSWYYYYTGITPEILLENLKTLKNRDVGIEFFQIDDGFQTDVGDWLSLRPQFQGRMRELSDSIREAGYEPGIWIAPFIATRGSQLVKQHPDYLLRNEYGRRLVAGYNFFWKGHYYYGLDVTFPRFEEYIRRVIRTIVHEWGYKYLKCDFLFGACLRGGTHHNLSLSRAEVLRYGLSIIREEAGSDAFIVGCGVPLSPSIGLVDAMRVGPDTGPYWIKRTAKILRTGAMVGARNSIRNTMVRSHMHGKLWLNDPDCLMLRRKGTHLSETERKSQINAVALSGGILLYSDDFSKLPAVSFGEIETINNISERCFDGRAIPIDLLEREIPQLYYNTAGYLGVFNGGVGRLRRTVNVTALPGARYRGRGLTDVWSGERFAAGEDGTVQIPAIKPHGSRLFRVEWDD